MLLGLAAYGVSLAVLWRNPSFGHEDAIAELIIFGLAFPLLAWITTWRAQPLAVTIRRSSGEMWLLFACLIGVMLYLVWGTALSELFVPLKWLAAPRVKFFIVLARKLIAEIAPAIFEDAAICSWGLRALVGSWGCSFLPLFFHGRRRGLRFGGVRGVFAVFEGWGVFWVLRPGGGGVRGAGFGALFFLGGGGWSVFAPLVWVLGLGGLTDLLPNLKQFVQTWGI